eukprot:comp17126_c0_seq1/m.15906 comp17126_c0_seq1/g.15906  ORF comp17126_c0_seq1/g.15906 comp17126_c0_seq1/m.15906 type:complete len:287 (-) comp17126_c0_seq1:47-907(-)
MGKFNAKKLKVDLKLAAQRCKNIHTKRSNLQAVARKEVAKLLASGKDDSARVKCEQIIREDNTLEVLEIMEMLCNTLLARFGIIDTMKYIEDSIIEPVCTILYAAPRLPQEVKEIHEVREELYNKYGGEVGIKAMENEGNCVNARVVKRLDPKPPSKKLVNAYLKEIADTHSVAWTPPPESPPPQAADATVIKPARSPSNVGGGSGVDTSASTFQAFLNDQSKAYQAQKAAPPSAPVDDLPPPPLGDEPDFDLPSVPSSAPPPGPPPPDSDDEFDDLAARFKQLKK